VSGNRLYMDTVISAAAQGPCLYMCVCTLSISLQVSFRLPTGILCGHAELFGKDGFCVSQPPDMCACRVSQKQIDRGLLSCWERFKAVNTVKTGMRQHSEVNLLALTAEALLWERKAYAIVQKTSSDSHIFSAIAQMSVT